MPLLIFFFFAYDCCLLSFKGLNPFFTEISTFQFWGFIWAETLFSISSYSLMLIAPPTNPILFFCSYSFCFNFCASIFLFHGRFAARTYPERGNSIAWIPAAAKASPARASTEPGNPAISWIPIIDILALFIFLIF